MDQGQYTDLKVDNLIQSKIIQDISKKYKIPVFEEISKIENEYDIFLFDMHGVLHSGGKILDKTKNTLIELRKSGKKVIIASNDTSSNKEYIGSLKNNKGITQGIHFDYAITSGDVFEYMVDNGKMTEQIKGQNYKEPIKIFVIDGLKNSVKDFLFKKHCDGEYRFIQVSDINSCDAVITGTPNVSGKIMSVADKEKYIEERKNYIKIIKDKKLPVIVPNPDTKTPNENGMQTIGAGRFGKICEKIGVKVIKTGKPSEHFYDYLKYKLYLAGIKYNKDRVAMVGDSFATDIIGGNNAGFKTVAVVNGGSNMGITAKKDIEKGRTKFQERLKQENAVPTMVIGHI